MSTLPNTLDRAWIAAHIPHQGRMCFLDQVHHWDATTLVCSATNHTADDHPLRDAGRLGAIVSVEYAAQAMAVHGALLASLQDSTSTPSITQGYLTSVRSLQLWVERLDDLPEALSIHIERVSGDERLILYQFRLTHAGLCIALGRASVVLDATRV